MSTILAQLAELSCSPVPKSVRDRIPARIIDIVGVAVRSVALDTSAAVIDFALAQGSVGRATMIGSGRWAAVPEAAFVNGVLAHSLDYDDTHLPSILHPSASVVPAALAVAETEPSSGADLLNAIALGLEITVRLGMGGYDSNARQSVYFERGQHATSICGTVGSAAAAARLLGLNESGICHAMGIAASMSSGIIEANRAGGTVKRLHCGWAARGGVTAAQLAARGITGPPTAIEGRFGLFQAFLGDQADSSAVTESLGESWLCDDIFFKPYPANHFTHAAIDAAMALRRRGVTGENLVSATLAVPPPTVRTIGEPIEAKRSPQSGYFAQFSGPYAVVVGLLADEDTGVGLADFSDALANDPQRRQLMSRVDVVSDPKMMEIYPFQFPARLSVATDTGETLVEEVFTNLGSPQRPLSKAQLYAKYCDNTSGSLTAQTIERTYRTLASVGGLCSTAALLSPFAQLRQATAFRETTGERL